MALCVNAQDDGGVGVVDENSLILVLSKSEPCDFYLIETKDLNSQLSAHEVGILFSAFAGLYALAFVFKLLRRQIGF